MFDFFDGKKVHLLVALPLAMVAIMEGWLGMDVPGVILEENWMEALWAALGISAGRDMVRKFIDAMRGN